MLSKIPFVMFFWKQKSTKSTPQRTWFHFVLNLWFLYLINFKLTIFHMNPDILHELIFKAKSTTTRHGNLLIFTSWPHGWLFITVLSKTSVAKEYWGGVVYARFRSFGSFSIKRTASQLKMRLIISSRVSNESIVAFATMPNIFHDCEWKHLIKWERKCPCQTFDLNGPY